MRYIFAINIHIFLCLYYSRYILKQAKTYISTPSFIFQYKHEHNLLSNNVKLFIGMIRNRSTTDANTKSPTENKNLRKTILFYRNLCFINENCLVKMKLLCFQIVKLVYTKYDKQAKSHSRIKLGRYT
jgi:hypothetical protein